MKAFSVRSQIENILLLLITIVLTIATPSFGEKWSVAQKKLWSIQEEVWKLWEKGDKEERLALYHNECNIWLYTVTFPGTKDYILRETTRIPKIEIIEIEPFEINIMNNVAIIQYSLSYSAFGKEVYERVMTTWIKQDGKWLIIGSMRSKHPSDSDRGAGKHG